MVNFQAESDYYKNFDFSNAKPVSEVPALVNLRENYRRHLAKIQDLSNLDEDFQAVECVVSTI